MATHLNTAARRAPRSPLVINISRLGRRPGSMMTFAETVPSPSRIGLDLIGVDEGAPRGNPADMPPPREFTDTSKWTLAGLLGPPDYVVMPGLAEGRDPSAILHHYVASSKRSYFQYGWRRALADAEAGEQPSAS